MMPLWLDILIAALLVIGASFALIGAYGLVKLGDFLKRLHGPTKASTVGVGAVLMASILYFYRSAT
jgi:multicomponent K+:H+ antiporter subunit G